MHICHIITGLNTGGAETVLVRLLESLPQASFRHTVVALGHESALSARVAQLAALHHLGMRGRNFAPATRRLRRIVHTSRADVIQGWMYHGNLMATLGAAGYGIPIAWGIRQSLYDIRREKWATRAVIRAGAWLSRVPARIVYNSAVSAEQHTAFGFSRGRVQVIPNGYDTGLFAPDAQARERLRKELHIAPGTLAIGLVARVHPMKDHANFLHAAALFVRNSPDAVFVLVGDGTEPGRFVLSGLIDKLSLAGRVRLCGRRTDIRELNNAIDISTSSSSWGEAFPNALAEAMACGTPCVATDVGDARDIVGETGVMVTVRDSAALCAGWTKLAALGEAGRRALGMQARDRIVRRFSLKNMTKNYADLYGELGGNISRCAG